MRIAATRTILSGLVFRESNKNLVMFDEKTKTISYSVSRDNSELVKARWENNMFVIDDYYLGGHMNDTPMPYPDVRESY